jgi:hypothetical protein
MTDAMQSIAIGGLRESKDTRLQMVFAAIGYWLTGLCLLDRVGGPHRNLCFASLLIQRFLRRAGSLEFERSPAGPRP